MEGGQKGSGLSHDRDNPKVVTAASDKPSAALARKRSNSSTATIPTAGMAISVAQKVKRSKVKMSKARPSSNLGKGVVPPSPKINVSQKPNSNGRNRRDEEPRIRMNGSARIKAPYGMTK